MNNIIATADITCLFFVIMLIHGSKPGSAVRDRPSKLYFWILLVLFIGLIIDSITYMGEGNIRNNIILYTGGFLAFILIDIIMILYILYVVSIIREHTNVPNWIVYIMIILTGIDIIMIAVGTVTGDLFSIIDYIFVYGAWYSKLYYIHAIITIILFLVLVKYRRVIGNRKFVVLSCYMIVPIIYMIFQTIFNFYYCGYAISSVTSMIIYIEIQSETIAASSARERVLTEVSYTDSLTNLKNRRSYEETLSKNTQFHGNIGAVFCDLNSLKYTNDNFGHAAGDQLLKNFAGMLTDAFSDGEIFRISGDEFVILLYDITQDSMDCRMRNFISTLYKNDRVAACGYEYGEDTNLLHLVEKAEIKMYEDKSLYYKETGRDRRR